MLIFFVLFLCVIVIFRLSRLFSWCLSKVILVFDLYFGIDLYLMGVGFFVFFIMVLIVWIESFLVMIFCVSVLVLL